MLKPRPILAFAFATLLILFVPRGDSPMVVHSQPAFVTGAASSYDPDAARGTAESKTSSAMFIENVGQFDPGARFQVRGLPGTVYLADDGIWFTLLDNGPAKEARARGPQGRRDLAEEMPSRGVNLRLSYTGANPHARMEGLNPQKTVVSYFLGNDPDKWRPNVPVWGGVRYVDIYPGVDLEITGENGHLNQRFVVRESGTGMMSLSRARLHVEGASGLSLEGSGLLTVMTDISPVPISLAQVELATGTSVPGSTVEKEKSSWLDGTPIVEGAEVAFPFMLGAVQAWTSPGTGLPMGGASDLVYSTFLGGSSSSDRGQGIAIDSAGNAYVTGYTYSTNFPTTPGAFQNKFGGSLSDIFVAKLAASGSALVYSTFLGGSGNDLGNSIAVDSAGNTYLTGSTSSVDFPTTSSAFQRSYGGNSMFYGDVYVAKLNLQGSALAYSTYLGGYGDDRGNGIVVDDVGSAYVVGTTGSTNFPTTAGAFQTACGCIDDAFVSKLSPSGDALVYSTYVGGGGEDGGYGIAIDGAGNAYVTGCTQPFNFPTTPGAFQTTWGGERDAFVARLNSSGSALTYATLLGGTKWDSGYAIAVDGEGSAYVTGAAASPNFPTTPGAFDTTHNGGNTSFDGNDAFVAKLNPTGNALVYSTFLGGRYTDVGNGIAVDGSGNAYVTGDTYSSNFPTTPGVFQTTFASYGASASDVFVAKLDTSGSTLVYSTFLGGIYDDLGQAVAVDGLGNAYVTGFTRSNNFPATPGAFDQTYNTPPPTSVYWDDAFVAKLRIWDSYKVTPRAYLPSIMKAYVPPIRDDFGDPASGWPITDDDVASSGYVNGEYRILIKQMGYLIRAGRSLDATDFRVEVDARAAGHTNGTYGLYFGSGDAGFYLYEVRNGQFRLARYNRPSRTWYTLISPTYWSVIRTGNQSNRLKIVRKGATIQLYANEVQVGQTTDNVLGQGYVGLAAGAYDANFDARFDNFLLVFDPNDTTTLGTGPGVAANHARDLSVLGAERNDSMSVLSFE